MKHNQGDTFLHDRWIYSATGSMILMARDGVPPGDWADTPADFIEAQPDAAIGLHDATFGQRANETPGAAMAPLLMALAANPVTPVEPFAHPRTAEPPANQAAVEIPADWRDMKFFAIKSLASKVSNTPITDKADAVSAIEAEIARRAAA